MTNEEKKELLIALCGYYPYGVICHDSDPNDPEYSRDGKLKAIRPEPGDCNGLPYLFELEGVSFLSDICEIKPYLRTMDSMTEEEQIKFSSLCELTTDSNGEKVWSVSVKGYDWLNANFFDYRNLIPRGMALPASEGMYED